MILTILLVFWTKSCSTILPSTILWFLVKMWVINQGKGLPIPHMWRNGRNAWRTYIELHRKTWGRVFNGEKPTMTPSHTDLLFWVLEIMYLTVLEKGGPRKLRSYWEQEIYVIVDHPNDDLPVYDVKKLNGSDKVSRLHRNLLLLCNYLPVPENCPKSREQHSQRGRKPRRKLQLGSSDSSSGVNLTITTTKKPLNPLTEVFTPFR